MKIYLVSAILLLSLIGQKIQAQSDVTRHLIEELIEEKTQGISIPSSDRMNSNIGLGAEPFIHISHFNPELMGIAYMGTGANWRLSLTEDGGNTWSEANVNTLDLVEEIHPNVQLLGGGDPTFVIDVDETIHFTFLYLYIPENGSLQDQGSWTLEVFYVVSEDFGQTWATRESLVDGTFDVNDLTFVDRTWMDINADQTVYCAGTLFSSSEGVGEQGTVLFSKHSDNTNFNLPSESAIPVPSLDAQTQHTNIEVGDDGTVHASGVLILPNSESVVYAKSDANGENFSNYIEIAPVNAIPNPTQVHGRESAAVSLSVDDENVYLAWSDFQDGDVLGFYAYSHDGGDTFSEPINLGDSYNGESHHILMPCLASDDGNMVITWHTVDKESSAGEYIAAYSDDAGVTLSTSYYNISDDFTYFGDFDNTNFFGDYNSVKMDGTVAHISWCDAHTSNEPRVYYSAIDFSTATTIAETQPLSDSFKVSDVFPNPVQDNFAISIDNLDAENLTIQLLSAEGKVVFSHTSKMTRGENKVTIDTSSLATGIYQLKLFNDQGFLVTKKIIKI